MVIYLSFIGYLVDNCTVLSVQCTSLKTVHSEFVMYANPINQKLFFCLFDNEAAKKFK